MTPTDVVFDSDKFMNKLKIYSQSLNESLKKNLKSQITTENNSKISSKKATIDAQTLIAFKKNVKSSYTGTTPEAVYKVLIQNMSDEILASDYFKLEDDLDDDPATLTKFLAKVANYIYEILDKKKTTLTIDNKKYQVEFPFGTTVTMATVTDLSNNKSYSLTWKDTGATLKTLTNFMSDLIAYEKSSSYQIVKKYLLDVIKIAVDDYIDYLADHTVVTKNVSDFLKDKLAEHKDDLESIGQSIDSIKEFFKVFFPQTDSELTQIQKNYQAFVKYESELEKAVSKLKNPDADTIKNLTAYKNFLSAYETLSGTNFNISPEDYVTYHFKDVHNAEIKENRASILGTVQVDSIISEGKNSTINGGDGNDGLMSEGSYSEVYGGTGDDKIIVVGENSKVYGEMGNDTIIVTGGSSKIYGGYGQDLVSVKGANVTVTGDGDTFDYLPIGDTFIIDNSARNVLITDFEKSADKLQLNFSDIVVDLIFVDGDQSLVILTADKYEKIAVLQGVNESSFNNITYNGITTSIDWLLENKKFTVKNPYEGIIQVKNNKLENTLFGVQIQAESGNNTITNKGSEITISAGTGNDSIENWGFNVTINAGVGNDSIINFGTSVTIDCGTGNDYIENNLGKNVPVGVLINTHSGDNTIKSGAVRGTINGGSGNDYIHSEYRAYETTINGFNGNDEIIVEGGIVRGRIDGGAGNDSIIIDSGFKTIIDAGDGDDLIHLKPGIGNDNYFDSTIKAGKGNDLIYIEPYDGDPEYDHSKYFPYAEGDGDDTIYGFHFDWLEITEGEYSVNIDGNDVIVKVGSGSITLKDAKNTTYIDGNIFGKKSTITSPVTETAKNISNTKSNTIISGTKYADTISNTASRVTIEGAADNDSITSIGDRVSISGGAGNDTLYSDVAGSIESGSNVTINGGAGDDYISNDSAYSKLEGNDGKDTITNYGWNTTIDGGTGDDVINNFNAFAGEGNNVLISGGAGKDSLTSTGQNDSIYGDEGNDTIYGWNSNILVDGGADNDYIYAGNYETNTSIYGGSGDDTITNFNSKSYIWGGKGNDLIYNDNQPNNIFLYDPGDGNDTIYGYNANDTIKITGDKYTTVKSGNDLKISVGTGVILLKEVANTTININGTLKSDNSAEDTLPIGITIKNQILTASNKFIGNKIDLKDYSGVTKINASAVPQSVSIVGSSENDFLKGGKGADTISGGFGNDTLTGGTGKDLFVYSNGNDVITDYKSGEDKIKIGEITSSSIKGSDVILTTSNGTLTVKGAKDKAISFIDNNGKNSEKIFFAGTSYVPLSTGLTYDSKRTVLTASNKFTGNTIDLGKYLGTVTKVNASAISQALNIVGNVENNSIKGGKGADKISGGNGKDTIFGGAGNDSLYGGSNDDKLQGDAGNDTLNGGSGNDTLTGGAGSDVFVYEKGNDVITDYKPNEDKIKLNPSTITSSTVKGSDVVLTTSNGALTVKGTKDKAITFIDSTGKNSEKIFFTGTSYVPLSTGLTYDSKRTVLTANNKFSGNRIDLSDYLPTTEKVNVSALSNGINVVGNSGNNSLKGGKGADTISGGSGKDTLTGGAGKDVFVYEGGNDIITDYKPSEDTVRLNPSAITSCTVKSSDVILTTSNGTLTLKGMKDKVITFIDNNGKATERIFYGNTSYAPLATGMTYDTKRTVLTASNKFTGNTIDLGKYLGTVTKVNASAVSQVLNIVGNVENNSIKGGKGADKISGGNGKDTIFGGTGNDSLYGGNDDDKLQGDAGNDTLNGGVGNDTLTGGAGNDVFIYESGNDVITDYAAGQDSIKVNGTISKVSYKGKNVIFSIGNGSLTVNNAKGKQISVTNNNQSQIYSRTLDILYDNNFITDEFNIDAVADVSEKNYSVGQMEYIEKNDTVTMCDSLVSASTFIDK